MKQKEFIKKYWLLFLLLILGIMLTGAFYGLELGQGSVKSECSNVADEKVIGTKFYGYGEEAEKARDYNSYYQQCLNQRGF